MSLFELAPAAIARVACFPLAAFDELADAELAGQAAEAHDDRRLMPAYETAYEAKLAIQRAKLWELTAGDARFMLALAFANPRLARIVAAEPARAPDRKDRRHIESRLYRYLARASARCQPFGMWAGVTLVRFGERTQVKRAPRVLRVAPDLAPWYALVRALARLPDYRHCGQWQLNPSLGQMAEREWQSWARGEGGLTGHTLKGWNAEPFRLLAECGPSSLQQLASALVPCCGSSSAAMQALETCIATGVVVGGLEPEWRFDSAWNALEAIEERLLTVHRSAWRTARSDMRSRSREIEECGEALASDEVLAAMRSTNDELRSLAASLGLACPPVPEATLRCDLHAPFEIELGEDIRAGIETTLDEYLRFQARWGFGPGMRRAILTHYLPPGTAVRALGAPPPPVSGSGQPTWQALGASLAADADFTARIERWEQLLAAGPGVQVAQGDDGEVPAPPFGWLQLGLRAGANWQAPVVHGVHDDLWGAYARHAPFWSQAGAKDALQSWLLDRLAQVERDAGLKFAELVAPCESAPNTLARPSLDRPLLSPYSCLPGAIDLFGARVVLEPGAAAPHLECPGHPFRLAVLNASAANVQSGDALIQLLFTTSLAATPAAVLNASSMLFACESSGRPSPVATLPGGAQVRSARMILGDKERNALRHPRPAQRFAAWAALARRERWPPLLQLRREDGLTLALHRDSPLALRALLAGADTQRLVVEHLPREDWLMDDNGQRFVAEFSIPFLRQRHIWSGNEARSGGGAT